MSSELALVLIVALLWGPTAIWLIIRFARGPRDSSRRIGMGDTPVDSAGELIWPTPGVKELAALVDDSEFWVCEACRSINRPGAKQCYACRLKRGAPVPAREPQPPATVGEPPPTPVLAPQPVPQRSRPDMVPVMAEPGEGRPDARPGKPAARPLAPAASAYVAGQWVASTTAAGASGSAAGAARPPARSQMATAEAGRRSVSATAERAPADTGAEVLPATGVESAAPLVVTTTGTVRAAGPATEPVPSATHRPEAGADRAAVVCPFVRLEGDPTTWYDFPHPGNLCHALAGERAPRRGVLSGLLGGRFNGSRPEVTTPEVQATLCLTPAHVQCSRFKAGRSRQEASGSAPSEPGPVELAKPPVRRASDPSTPVAGPVVTSVAGPTAVAPEPANGESPGTSPVDVVVAPVAVVTGPVVDTVAPAVESAAPIAVPSASPPPKRRRRSRSSGAASQDTASPAPGRARGGAPKAGADRPEDPRAAVDEQRPAEDARAPDAAGDGAQDDTQPKRRRRRSPRTASGATSTSSRKAASADDDAG